VATPLRNRYQSPDAIVAINAVIGLRKSSISRFGQEVAPSIVAFLWARFRILGELFIAPTQLRRARNVPKIPPFVKILIGTFLPATRPRYLHIRRANTSLNPDECLHAVECVLVGGDCTFRIVHLNCLSRVLRDRISRSFRNLTTQCVDVRSPN
jgi:hypothetical protein